MENYIFNNSYAEFSGEVTKEPVFSHSVNEEDFYTFTAKSMRLSGFYDEVPILVSANTVNIENLKVGSRISVVGQFRSHNRHENGFKLILNLYAASIDILDEKQGSLERNDVYLKGTVCRKPTLRKTPKGRTITECLIAVNRTKKKSDYIPVIFWGRNAYYASEMEVGTVISVTGRIQSREYMKVLSEDEKEVRVAYEVSGQTIAWEG